MASVADTALNHYPPNHTPHHSSVTCRRSVVSSTRKLISSSFHRLDMTLAVAEALTPNKPNQTTPHLLDMVLAVGLGVKQC